MTLRSMVEIKRHLSQSGQKSQDAAINESLGSSSHFHFVFWSDVRICTSIDTNIYMYACVYMCV